MDLWQSSLTTRTHRKLVEMRGLEKAPRICYHKLGLTWIRRLYDEGSRHAVAMDHLNTVKNISAKNNSTFADIFTFGKALGQKNVVPAFATA